MNLSFNISSFSPESQSVQVNDLIKNWVVQIDDKIFFCLFLFIILYFIKNIILPRAEKGLYSIVLLENMKTSFKFMFDQLFSLLDTIILGCAISILYICWIQGYFNQTYKIIFYIMGGILLIVLVAEIIEYIRKKCQLKKQC